MVHIIPLVRLARIIILIAHHMFHTRPLQLPIPERLPARTIIDLNNYPFRNLLSRAQYPPREKARVRHDGKNLAF
jgi:hypothetical protein